MGKLFICPTPIGNLEDITFRVINTLKTVDIIAAEDTRHTVKLLNHFEIKNKLISYHEHNKVQAGEAIISKLKSGLNIALVSDAGMPGISDPGEDLVKLCVEENIPVEALPGASAVITALAASGLSTRRFFFEGFLDRNKKERKCRLDELAVLKETIVFYESPHRLTDTLKDMVSILGNRQIVLARELTKKYEEYFRGTIQEAIDYFKEKGIKGEFVLILEGNKEIIETVFETSVEERLNELIQSGTRKKEAITLVAKERKMQKKEVYNIAIDIEYKPE